MRGNLSFDLPMPPYSLWSRVFAMALPWVAAAVANGQVCTSSWLPGPGLVGANDQVFACAAWDPDGGGPLGPRWVVSGLFTGIGTTAANRIAA
jgi:hypothetical protein